MKKRYAKIVVPVLMGVLCAAPGAFADEPNGESSFEKHYYEKVKVKLTDEVNTSITRENINKSSIKIKGSVNVTGEIKVKSSISALIDNKQMNESNHVINYLHTNEAGTDATAAVLQGAKGNIGLNMAAGDNNLQDNAAALAASDTDFVFDAADATVVVNQDSVRNEVCNHGTTNTAGLGGNSLRSAVGSIGVNIAAGNSNLQKNNLSATAASAGIGTAAVTVMQQTGHNFTANKGHYDKLRDTIRVRLSGTLSQEEADNKANITGGYSGTSDQYGDVYPDIWEYTTGVPTNQQHGTADPQTHHLDLDNVVQAQLPDDGNPATDETLTSADIDPRGDGGALLFNDKGSLDGVALSDLALGGTLSGRIVDVTYVAAPTINTASLSGNVLMEASGNIGVNVAAGTNNLQSNSLAMIANNNVE